MILAFDERQARDRNWEFCGAKNREFTNRPTSLALFRALSRYRLIVGVRDNHAAQPLQPFDVLGVHILNEALEIRGVAPGAALT